MQVLASLRKSGLIDHHDRPLIEGMSALIKRAA